ncbi:MAG: nucleoside deaminase [Deltaproteobacteria bacterium]|nr:nucleoside deaminase [Deltaproteobacteria bacterium]MBW2660545.1 nucleoside deaminase [Deltaproteobacteria bacterium]
MDYNYFMEKALDLAREAFSAGEFPVGCVMVYQNKILVTGSRTGTTGNSINEIDHAEIIAVRKLAGLKENIEPKEITLFCTLEPCLMCYCALVLCGIGEIVYAYEDVMSGCTGCDLTKSAPLFRNNLIPVMPSILRNRSLELFKKYFSKFDNTYWRGSLLASYTLIQ